MIWSYIKHTHQANFNFLFDFRSMHMGLYSISAHTYAVVTFNYKVFISKFILTSPAQYKAESPSGLKYCLHMCK